MKNTRKILCVVLSIIISLSLTSCKKEEKDMIKKATQLLENHWTKLYQEDDRCDGYFEIKNTRIIYIKENNIETFKNVKCIIEFDLYTDWFGTAPYYSPGYKDTNVVVYKDSNRMEVQTNVIDIYRSQTYTDDFSDFIESVVDCKGKYNYVKKLK